MEKLIFLIRHGSLPEEMSGRLIGQCGTPLSDQGVREAAACGRFLADVRFDAVFAGTLPRVSQTLEAFAEYGDAESLRRAVRDPRLNEFDFGEWTERFVRGLTGKDAELYAGWNFGNPEFSFPGGELVSAFTERTRAAWRDICATPGERIAVFSHGGVIMSLLADIVGLDRRYALRLWVARGGLARVHWDAEKRTGRVALIAKPIEFESPRT